MKLKFNIDFYDYHYEEFLNLIKLYNYSLIWFGNNGNILYNDIIERNKKNVKNNFQMFQLFFDLNLNFNNK
jgi:hypothetical protein